MGSDFGVITGVEIWQWRNPFPLPQWSPDLASLKESALYVRLFSGDREAWGESPTTRSDSRHSPGLPQASAEMAEVGWSVLGLPAVGLLQSRKESENWDEGHHAALVALEEALLSLSATITDSDIVQVLGVAPLGDTLAVRCGRTIPRQSDSASTLRLVASAVADGVSRVKLKCSPETFGEVVRHLSTIELGAMEVILDGEGTLDQLHDREIGEVLDGTEVKIEQPFSSHNFFERAAFLRFMGERLILDESVLSTGAIEHLGVLFPEAAFVLRPWRLGGLFATLDIAQVLKSEGRRFYIGGMGESELGTCANVYVHLLAGADLVGDFDIQLSRVHVPISSLAVDTVDGERWIRPRDHRTLGEPDVRFFERAERIESFTL